MFCKLFAVHSFNSQMKPRRCEENSRETFIYTLSFHIEVRKSSDTVYLECVDFLYSLQGGTKAGFI